MMLYFFFSSRRRHTRWNCDWSSDVCSSDLDGLRGELERLGYTPLSAAGHVRLVAHLSRWMILGGVSISALTPATVDAYFAERRAAGYSSSLTARSLRPLLDYLHELGVVAAPGPVIATTPCERLLD